MTSFYICFFIHNYCWYQKGCVSSRISALNALQKIIEMSNKDDKLLRDIRHLSIITHAPQILYTIDSSQQSSEEDEEQEQKQPYTINDKLALLKFLIAFVQISPLALPNIDELLSSLRILVRTSSLRMMEEEKEEEGKDDIWRDIQTASLFLIAELAPKENSYSISQNLQSTIAQMKAEEDDATAKAASLEDQAILIEGEIENLQDEIQKLEMKAADEQ